jgi:hypothetical protein
VFKINVIPGTTAALAQTKKNNKTLKLTRSSNRREKLIHTEIIEKNYAALYLYKVEIVFNVENKNFGTFYNKKNCFVLREQGI